MLLAVFHRLHSTYEKEGRARAALLGIFLDALLTYDVASLLELLFWLCVQAFLTPPSSPLSPSALFVFMADVVEALRVRGVLRGVALR